MRNSYISGFLLDSLSNNVFYYNVLTPTKIIDFKVFTAIKLGLAVALYRSKEVIIYRENSLYAGGILPRD